MSDPHWQLHPNVHPLTVSTFLDAIMDLGLAAEGLRHKKSLFDTDGGWRVLQAVVRQISVPLRKLCLDKEGALFKKAIANPTFHPLGGQKGRYRRATLLWRSEPREWVMGFADGKEKTVVVPETEHEIEIGRLYGVDFLEDGWCAIHRPFDLAAHPVPLDAWLDAKALQVNSVSYTIRDALGLVADYEGAHANELHAWIAVGVNPEDMDKGRKMKYRLVNSVYFGCLSYVHVVALYTALYLTGQVRELLAKSASTLGRGGCFLCQPLNSEHRHRPSPARTHCQRHPRDGRCRKVGCPRKPPAPPHLPPLVRFAAVGRPCSRPAPLRSGSRSSSMMPIQPDARGHYGARC